MTNFAGTLDSLLVLEKKTQEQLAAESGVDRSTISRMLRGRIPTREQLGRLVAAISTDRARQIELLVSHLRDEAAAARVAGIDERHLNISPAHSEHTSTIEVAGTLGAELQLISEECVRHADVREVISDLSRMLMRHRAELLDARATYPERGDIGMAADENAHFATTGTPAALPADHALEEEKARRRASLDSKSAS